MKRLQLLVLLPCLLAPGCFVARRQPLGFRFGAEAATRYVRRGVVQNARGVVQSELDVTLPTVDGGQVDVDVWGNLDLRGDTGDAWLPDGHAGRFSQIDLTGSWSRSFERGDLTLGWRSYTVANGPEFPVGPRSGTAELFATVGHDWRGYYPTVTLFYDYDAVGDVYVNGRVVRWFRFDDPRLAGEASVSLGLSGADHSEWAYGAASAGFADLRASFDLHYVYDEITTYRFFVAGSTLVDGDLRDGVEALGIEPSNVWAGVGVVWRL